MGTDLKIVLHEPTGRNYLTNDDVLRGEVRLTTTSSLSLSCIQVKLEGISSTQMMIPDTRRQHREKDSRKRRSKEKEDRRLKERALHDSHKFLYETAIVFPPENIRQASSSDFTLGPGTYTYPFEFRFPSTTACTRISGITNIVSINKKSKNVVWNNGNFGVDQLKKSATSYIQSINNPNLRLQHELQQEEALKQCSYHIEGPLPPTFAHDRGSSTIYYFVKVTCKRSSLLKQNYRKSKPFNFRPLEIENNSDQFEHKEVFYRREFVFPNRSYGSDFESLKALPKVPAKEGFFRSFFGSSYDEPQKTVPSKQSKRKQIPFGLEVRLREGASFVPGCPPPLKLYFTSEIDPSTFSLSQYGSKGSSGLGVIYIQSLSIEMETITRASVLESTTGENEIHEQESAELIPLCKNVYENLKFDLVNATGMVSTSTTSVDKISPNSFELEIPKQFYENCRVPKNLVPAFRTCNISRSYNLVVLIGVSSEPANNKPLEVNNQMVIDIVCPDICVLTGFLLHSPSKLSPNILHDYKQSLPERPPNLPARRTEKGEHLFQNESRREDAESSDYRMSDPAQLPHGHSGSTGTGTSSVGAPTTSAQEEAPPPSYNDVLMDISR